jgi:hypothetical protein
MEERNLFVLAYACRADSFRDIHQELSSDSSMDLLAFYPVPAAQALLAAKWKGKPEQVAEVTKSLQFNKIAHLMGPLDRVSVSPRGEKGVLRTDHIIVSSTSIGTEWSANLCAETLPEIILNQQCLRNQLKIYINSLDKVMKRLKNDFAKLCKGARLGSFLASIESRRWKRFLIFWRTREVKDVEAMLKSEKPSLENANTAVVMVLMRQNEATRKMEPDFREFRVLFKKCANGHLTQGRAILAGIDAICKEGVSDFILIQGCGSLGPCLGKSWGHQVHESCGQVKSMSLVSENISRCPIVFHERRSCNIDRIRATSSYSR